MAIAFDAAVTDTGGASPRTIAVTVAATSPILFVSFGNNSTSDTATGVTFNGAAMTQVAKKQAGATSPVWSYLYAIVGQSGTHNVVITLSSGSIYRATCSSYTGVNQSITWTGTPTDNTATANSNNTSSTINSSVTTIADNSWVFTCCWGDNGTVNTTTTNITIRGTAQVVTQAGDSNAAVTPAGAYSQTWNAGGNEIWAMIQATFSPAVAAGPANVKTWDGITQSTGVKTYGALALASTKTWDGVA